ncbi:MAG: DNA alkylation repair protein [Selenomonadaceae bacterium]|nr:DNA alkylation repair protein [Selenomonadaceae bacterium]
MEINEIVQRLKEHADEDYRHYTAKLVPNVPLENIIGVRAPLLQEIMTSLDAETVEKFRATLPHNYHEENVLHAYLLSEFTDEADYQRCLEAIDKFLPFVDNWAVCDAIAPKIFSQHPKGLEEKILEWLRADRPYTIRLGLSVLMKNYLDDFFDEEHFQWVMDIASNDHYALMAQAWYFATALTKRYEQTLPLLENDMLDPTVHAMTIQKAVESRRIPYERKKYLRTLKRTDASK